MKKIIETVESEGLESLLGEEVMIFAANYIYAGILSGVSETDVLLSNAKIVYETGPFNEKGYSDAQHLPSEWRIRANAIESYGKGK